MNQIDALREAIIADIQGSERQIADWGSTLALDHARLSAHDAAVAALRAEQPASPLSPTTLDPADATRAARRDIKAEVWERLTGEPQTTEQLVEAIGGVKISQVQAALLKLGDKVIAEAQVQGNGEAPGYIRAARQVPLRAGE